MNNSAHSAWLAPLINTWFLPAQGVVRKEVSDFVQQNNELRGGKTLDEMASFDWNTVYEDVEKACPVLTNVLVGTLTTNSSFKYMGLASKTSSSAKPIVGTVASIIMYNRRRTLSHFQEMNSLQMWLSSAKREVRQLRRCMCCCERASVCVYLVNGQNVLYCWHIYFYYYIYTL